MAGKVLRLGQLGGVVPGMLRRLLSPLGINLVPIGGVFLAGWSPATALSLYWWENLIGSVLVALRILAHRALTRKRGHRRQQLGLQVRHETTLRGGRRAGRRRGGEAAVAAVPAAGSFLAEFVVAACAATLLHGALLWFLLRRVLDDDAQGAQLRQGVIAVAAVQLLAFALDLAGIRARPFAWIREQAQAAVARVTLVHLAIILGFWFGAGRAGLSGFFGPFAVLKLLADVGNSLHRAGLRLDSEEAPAWLAATLNRLRGDRGDFAEHWREEKQRERQLWEQDEEVAG